MRISIDHETTYRYEKAVTYSVQSLRLTPQPYDGLVVRKWSVEGPEDAVLSAFTDSFGNITHTLSLDQAHDQVCIRVQGLVDTLDTSGVLSGTLEPFPPGFYLRETTLTRPDATLCQMAEDLSSGADGRLGCLHRLMFAIRKAVEYKTGETDVMTTAREAYALGAGVCQDHAHIFIAAARHLSIPVRYVSGYLLHTDTGEESEASHAWAEAYVPDLGWVGFDVANSVCVNHLYVRIGVGLDYQEAAPVRGMRCGGAGEELRVGVRMQQVASSLQ